MYKLLGFLALVITGSVLSGVVAQAADYGSCAASVSSFQQDMLEGTTPAPIKAVTKLNASPVLVFTVAPPKQLRDDDVVPVYRAYDQEIYDLLLAKPTPHAWVGIVIEPDRTGASALWMRVWVSRGNQCATDVTYDRVYGRRGNAPNVFAQAIDSWEKAHPERALHDYGY